MAKNISNTYCSIHSLREGSGICIKCHNPFCSECLTRFDGINYCKECLEKITSKESKKRFSSSFLKTFFLILFSFCIFLLTFYLAGKIALENISEKQIEETTDKKD
ncbi:MAG: hypothetical protein KAI43_02520 [Candidatus Aureabacteria bacterium]|nr:hypothetical protein [Candidatus Auribacterota bacterium]